jgi:hypothetical protein
MSRLLCDFEKRVTKKKEEGKHACFQSLGETTNATQTEGEMEVEREGGGKGMEMEREKKLLAQRGW